MSFGQYSKPVDTPLITSPLKKCNLHSTVLRSIGKVSYGLSLESRLDLSCQEIRPALPCLQCPADRTANRPMLKCVKGAPTERLPMSLNFISFMVTVEPFVAEHIAGTFQDLNILNIFYMSYSPLLNINTPYPNHIPAPPGFEARSMTRQPGFRSRSSFSERTRAGTVLTTRSYAQSQPTRAPVCSTP